MSRESSLLAGALISAQKLAPLVVRGLIKARVGNLAARRDQFDSAIESARQLHDELVTARTALGWAERKEDVA